MRKRAVSLIVRITHRQAIANHIQPGFGGAVTLSAWLILLLLVLAAVFAQAWYRLRVRHRRFKGKPYGSKIPTVPIWELDPLFAVTAAGPSRETEVAHIAAVRVVGGVSDLESWILCVLAKQSRNVFEFGTATGKTTYLMARSSPQARIVTLTLAPDQTSQASHDNKDDAASIEAARSESSFDTFVYSGTDVEPRIEQLFGDSKVFDTAPYAESIDLIFVDGDHTESYVRSDTEKAMQMLAPGGWLLWHDFRSSREAPGVWRFLHALHRTQPLVHIQDTALVAYRKPPKA
jgi:predicted O-methyltransferase YrrM